MAKEIDARGLSCPQPVFLTLKAIEEEKVKQEIEASKKRLWD